MSEQTSWHLFHPGPQSGFVASSCRLRSRLSQYSEYQEPVWFSVAPVVILSAGSVTESCVILFYCVTSIVALFVSLSGIHRCLLGSDAELFTPPGGESCFVISKVSQIGALSRKKVALSGAGVGNS